MGDFCWQSGEVVLVVIEEEKRSVETFYDCVDLDLEENPIDIDKVRSTTERNPYERMNNDDECCCFFNFDINVVFLSGIIHICQNLQRRLNKPIGTNCEETQGKGVSKFRCRIPEKLDWCQKCKSRQLGPLMATILGSFAHWLTRRLFKYIPFKR